MQGRWPGPWLEAWLGLVSLGAASLALAFALAWALSWALAWSLACALGWALIVILHFPRRWLCDWARVWLGPLGLRLRFCLGLGCDLALALA